MTRTAFLMGIFASTIIALLQGYQMLGIRLPILVIGVVAFLAAILQWIWIEQRSFGRIYEGLADFFLNIHTPSIPEQGWKWFIRGVISALLAVAGGLAGMEGPAIELSYALAVRLRTRGERWFEQRRRTDSASAIAAGISAAFGAPFAGFIMPMELGMGGRMLSSALSSVFAFLGVNLFKSLFPIQTLDLSGGLNGFTWLNLNEWLGICMIAVAAALIGMLLVRFFRYCQSGFLDLFRSRGWPRMIFGGLILLVVVTFYRGAFLDSSTLLEQVLAARRVPLESAFAFFARTLSLAIVLASFGTLGIFWPIFTLGGLLGYSIYEVGFHSISSFGAAACFIGAAALWSSVLGTPLAATVLVYEVTQNALLLPPCLVAAFLARECVRLAPGQWSRGLVDFSMELRGLPLSGGRSVRVLEKIEVKDAMVTDFESVLVNEPVSELRPKLLRSRYPYLPVVNSDGNYQGLLSFDMVREAWDKNQTVISAPSALSKLLEVKDLLYRAGITHPTVRQGQNLAEVNQLMDRFPCVTVIDTQGRVSGLLLVQNVRQAYDREVIRRSLDWVMFNMES